MNKYKRQKEIYLILAFVIFLNTILITIPEVIHAYSIDEYYDNIGKQILRLDYALIVVPKKNHRPANLTMDGWLPPQSSLGELVEIEEGKKYRLRYNASIPIQELEPRVTVKAGGENILQEYNHNNRYRYHPDIEFLNGAKLNPGVDREVEGISRFFPSAIHSTDSNWEIPKSDVKVIRNKNSNGVRHFPKSTDNYRSVQFPTIVSYPMRVDVELDESNRIDLDNIGDMERIAHEFRTTYKGNASEEDYGQTLMRIRSEFYEKRGNLYKYANNIKMPTLPNSRIPVELIDNLMVESAKDINDRISVHEVIIPSLITIDNVRSKEVQDKLLTPYKIPKPEGERTKYEENGHYIVNEEQLEKLNYTFYDYKFNEGRRDYKGYDFSIRSGGRKDLHEPINYNPEQTDETYMDESLVTSDTGTAATDNWHVRNPKEKLKATPNNVVGEIGKYNTESYRKDEYIYDIDSEVTGGTQEGKDLLTYPTESIHHTERTVAPKTTSPPNVILGMPVNVIGYAPANPKPAEERVRDIPGGIKVVSQPGDKIEVTFRYKLRDGYDYKDRPDYDVGKEQREKHDNEDSLIIINYEDENGNNFEPSRIYYLESGKEETISADIFISYELVDNNPIELGANTAGRVQLDHSQIVLEKITEPRGKIYDMFSYDRDSTEIQDLIEQHEQGLIDLPASNTPMIDYLIEPEGRIIYNYLDITSFDQAPPTNEGLAQNPEGKKFNKIEGKYEVREGWMGTKELFNQYEKLTQPNYKLNEIETTDLIMRFNRNNRYVKGDCLIYDKEDRDKCVEYKKRPVHDYTVKHIKTESVVNTDRHLMDRLTNSGFESEESIYTPYGFWAHRSELEMQHHAAISNARAGLYDFSNRKNKATKSGYGVIQESKALMQTDWPRSGEVRARLVRSKGHERLDENAVVRDFSEPGIAIEKMQARSSTPNRPNSEILDKGLATAVDRKTRDEYWKSLNYGQEGNEPPKTIPFDKINKDLKYHIEWSTARGEFHALPQTSLGEIKPAFGPTRQHFIHVDHPNGNFNVESWVAIDFGEEMFNVIFAAPLSIPIKGNMFDDSFTTIE